LGKKNRILLVKTASMILGYMPWYNFSAALKYLADRRYGSARVGLNPPPPETGQPHGRREK